ncbi:MAG: hypothetical protein WCP46_00420 [Alphaproteobacteria bacterium]
MNPKEKAKELVYKYHNTICSVIDHDMAKQCALIAVDEIIKSRPLQPMNWDENQEPITQINWWKQVKQEIEKL